MHQVSALPRLDAAILEQPIDARIGGDDGVEDARMRIGIELNENFRFGHGCQNCVGQAAVAGGIIA